LLCTLSLSVHVYRRTAGRGQRVHVIKVYGHGAIFQSAAARRPDRRQTVKSFGTAKGHRHRHAVTVWGRGSSILGRYDRLGLNNLITFIHHIRIVEATE